MSKSLSVGQSRFESQTKLSEFHYRPLVIIKLRTAQRKCYFPRKYHSKYTSCIKLNVYAIYLICQSLRLNKNPWRLRKFYKIV